MADDLHPPKGDLSDAEAPRGSSGISDAELEARFFEWSRSAPSLEPAPEAPPEELDPEEEARRLMLRRGLRFLMLLVVTLVAIWAMASSYGNMRYALSSDEQATDLGDLRQRVGRENPHLADLPTGAVRPLDVPSNTRARLEGAVITLEAVSKNGSYSYFYSPLYKIIVQTPQQLPAKNPGRSVGVPQHLLYLVLNRDIFPYDLTASFRGDGRMFRALDVPAAVRPVLDFYLPRVDVPAQELYVFFDGDTPDANFKYIFVWVGALLVFAAALFMFIRTLRRRGGR